MNIRSHLFGLAMVLAPGLAAADLNMVEGYWDTMVHVNVEGGFMPVPAIKSSRCLTKQDPIPNAVETASHCQVTPPTITGNDVAWSITCADDKARTEGQGKITYAGESFNGRMDIVITEISTGRQAKMKYYMRGMRTRACDH